MKKRKRREGEKPKRQLQSDEEKLIDPEAGNNGIDIIV